MKNETIEYTVVPTQLHRGTCMALEFTTDANILNRALFSLHRAQLAYNRKSGVSDVCESSQYSILALNAISRILLALAQTVNSVSTVDGSSLLSLEPPCPIFP